MTITIRKIVIAVFAISFIIQNNAVAGSSVKAEYEQLSWVESSSRYLEYTRSNAPQNCLRVYDFKQLYAQLGYNASLFGATADEISALNEYTDQTIATSNYKDINNYLRLYPAAYNWTTISPERAARIVRNMDGLFVKVPALPYNMVMFRGITMKFHGNKSYEPSEEYIDKAYVSTSLDDAVAKHFVLGLIHDKTARRAILVIYSGSPGNKGILINAGEYEVILPHGATFRVMDTRTLHFNPDMDLCLVQLCSDSCESDIPARVLDFWRNYTLSRK
ncbi:MAG: ADP-ribosyltransferase [Elusimicrobiales bacterium]